MQWIDLVTPVSVAIAAASFVSGVSAWKREFVGKRRIELAQSVLALFYEAQDAVAMIRNPISYVGEGKSREHAAAELPEETEALDQAYVAFERYHKREQLFAQLQSMRYQFMAAFGTDAAEPFNELTSAVNQILIAARALGTRYWPDKRRRPMSEEQFKMHLEQERKYESIFWSHEENDEIAQAVRGAIAKVEAIAKREVDVVQRRPMFARR